MRYLLDYNKGRSVLEFLVLHNTVALLHTQWRRTCSTDILILLRYAAIILFAVVRSRLVVRSSVNYAQPTAALRTTDSLEQP